ncbi:S66 family peptidase [Facklamia miroungae]|uniref:Muramoyltetrapeptide carboxypeptidase LdcA (Peptidoglycan recycling) n=1 Tax=Facklamia miroungae TaxID=120956 RepID=A0A1G7VE57_9LACT|nr:S66 peptidase family protein [Facklamia miroungae]NKZ30307.1 LD-carboxypeptidase [Facklamia miroungae]SDG58034.1 Muramoyltetrapeptide carboxypeptidase LdcA (peptidoglycan recycling) [Facklamia miroungae]
MKVKKIGIVSLSSGLLGENNVKHELNIGIDRIRDYGIEIEFLPHSLKGIEYLKNHPESRASDLIQAFQDDSIDMILCAIGGDDTYRLLPYLFENDELKRVVNQKLFLGFSDTTMNHFMLNKLGIKTFYGQSFLSDVCEISTEMLPYTKKYFEELIYTGRIKEIKPSNFWYDERSDFSVNRIGVSMKSHSNDGFELINGKSIFEGEILGGCLEVIYYFFDNFRYEDTTILCNKYGIFPTIKDWENKILLSETSEEKPDPAFFRRIIRALDDFGIFEVISGLLVGKPQDEIYYNEYKATLLQEISNKDLPIVYNVNIGHATPRCIIPFGINAKVNTEQQVISFNY